MGDGCSSEAEDKAIVHRLISRSVPALMRVIDSPLLGDSVSSNARAKMPRVCPLSVCSFSPEATSQTMMLASADAEIRISLFCNVHTRTALTKSLCPWYRLLGLRVEHVQDHIDLSQQPAKTVSDFGETATDVSGAVGPENVADTSADYKGSQPCVGGINWRVCRWQDKAVMKCV
jgi:hypothetical protein